MFICILCRIAGSYCLVKLRLAGSGGVYKCPVCTDDYNILAKSGYLFVRKYTDSFDICHRWVSTGIIYTVLITHYEFTFV